ncbi:hypothetical protein Pla175_47500 [Pirellulimonas nuda]|uniref:Carboxypeptidase regulatory-like domain-containing protein n=1 Tax=Pirellulimonas nuda TaxID=2528009 RepID=A0A518DIM0_9BACT|nr:hypothetical protein [Pirellulimonas nuda]QDU91329.1 hypothetical protein Pla175_47500 [Pirellulimonas nuda]
MANFNRRLFCVATLATLVGCGGGPDYPIAPVHGVVSIDGKPLEGGRLMFAPVAAPGALKSGKPGFADIDADGSYAVGTYADQDGAVVGEHWVSLINLDPKSPAGQRIKAERVTVPNRVTVVDGQDNQIVIELTTQQIKQHGQFK